MRLIDADALIEGLLVNPEECPGCPEPEWLEDFVNTIDSAPTIEIPACSDGDTISRQAAIDAIIKADYEFTGILSEPRARRFEQTINALPSAQPDLPSSQPDLCDGCDRYGASCVGEGCGKLEMPEVAKDINAPNNDTISRQAMFDTAAEYEKQLCEILGDENELVEVVKILKHRLIALPSAQPDLSEYSDKLWRNAYERGKAEAQVEIIRCRDCKHWREGTTYTYCDKLFRMGVLDIYDYMTTEDDFCSGAERRTDGVDN